jgi:hypothetical protein
VDIHEVVRIPWVSTTRMRRGGPSVAAMTALNVTSPQQQAWDRPQPILWLQVLGARRRLDRSLAAGTSPATDARHTMRARQLVAPPARMRLASALLDAVQSVDEPRFIRVPRPEIPVSASAVRDCDVELRDLAHALTDPYPRVRGVVLARALLTDGNGPLYAGGAGELRRRVLVARSAL